MQERSRLLLLPIEEGYGRYPEMNLSKALDGAVHEHTRYNPPAELSFCYTEGK